MFNPLQYSYDQPADLDENEARAVRLLPEEPIFFFFSLLRVISVEASLVAVDSTFTFGLSSPSKYNSVVFNTSAESILHSHLWEPAFSSS